MAEYPGRCQELTEYSFPVEFCCKNACKMTPKKCMATAENRMNWILNGGDRFAPFFFDVSRKKEYNTGLHLSVTLPLGWPHIQRMSWAFPIMLRQ